MTTTATTITPDTTIYTFTADFVGYTLEDSILGNMSVAEYARNSRGDEAGVADLCQWLGEMMDQRSGFWLSEADAEAWLAEQMDADARPTAHTLTAFTPRSIHDHITEMATNEAE